METHRTSSQRGHWSHESYEKVEEKRLGGRNVEKNVLKKGGKSMMRRQKER